MDSLREDLDHLVASPGWAHFRAYVEREWGTRTTGGGAYFSLAARKAIDNPDDMAALAHLRQIGVAQKEIHNLFAWVEQQLMQAKKHEHAMAAPTEPHYSRRGGL